MRISKVSAFAAIFSIASAIVPEAKIALADNKNKPGPQSLPNLLTVADVEALEKDWTIGGSMTLAEGRLLVDRDAGSLWSKKLLENSKDEWTVELVFRNSEIVDVDDHSYFDTNGISLWLLDSEKEVDKDTLNYGGPSTFDGFQFLMNNKESRGLKILANDGSKKTENVLSEALGFCAINYLDSMVPFTLRISYSAPKKWFKIQIDNNLCFKTELLTFDNLKNDFQFGVTASTDSESKEYWEVLQLNTYPYLTEDAIDDHGIIADGGISVVTVTASQKSEETILPEANRLSLLERARKFREDAEKAKSTDPVDTSAFDKSLKEINSKLTLLAEMIDRIDSTKVDELSHTIEEVKVIQNEQMTVLNHMKDTYTEFETLLNVQYKEMTQAISKLHEKMLDEIKGHQKEVLSIGEKVDLLMANHKEIQDDYRSSSADLQREPEFFNVIIKWVLLPFVVSITALTVILYRLRKDIKHSKLL